MEKEIRELNQSEDQDDDEDSEEGQDMHHSDDSRSEDSYIQEYILQDSFQMTKEEI